MSSAEKLRSALAHTACDDPNCVICTVEPTAYTDFGETPKSLNDVEREHILRILKQVKGNKLMAAKILRISRGTLYRRLRAYGLDHLVRDPLEGLK